MNDARDRLMLLGMGRDRVLVPLPRPSWIPSSAGTAWFFDAPGDADRVPLAHFYSPGDPAGACGTVVSFLVIRWRAEEDAGRVPLCAACRPFARGDAPAPKTRRARK